MIEAASVRSAKRPAGTISEGLRCDAGRITTSLFFELNPFVIRNSVEQRLLSCYEG